VKQFILEKMPDKDGTVRLEGGDYRYLVRVRRLKEGGSFSALLPNGEETLVHVLSVDNYVLIGKCITPENITPISGLNERNSPLPPIILFQALPKGDKMDLIVRQAAEGGITEIVPFVSEFSAAKVKTAEQKFSRWERIIKEARQQSGSKTATSIRRPLTESGLFEYWQKLKSALDDPVNGGLGLLFHHQGLEQESLHSYLNNVPQIAAFAIGPEGGFSGKEVSLFLENGFNPFTIRDTVFRTETAALYFAAVIKILLLERDSWKLKQA